QDLRPCRNCTDSRSSFLQELQPAALVGASSASWRQVRCGTEIAVIKRGRRWYRRRRLPGGQMPDAKQADFRKLVVEFAKAISARVDSLEVTLTDRFDRVDVTLAQMDGKFEQVEANVERIDKRLGSMDTRLDAMDERFDSMDTRFESMDTRFDAMDTRFDAMDKRFDELIGRFDDLTGRFDRLESKLDK
ncbi:MAG TPA: hypothetical protein VF424_09965, partial [Vicinamibacterales bacterium]